MQSITDDIYVEDQYPGATLGVINMPHGLIQVDAPPSLEDGRAWRAALLNLGGGSERLLVNLDAHPDRTLGARAMDCTVVAQEKTAHVFRNRPTTFKAVGEETGADWESIPGLGNIRWITPEITFSHQMAIHWGESSVVLEHHPGPTAGAAWVIVPEEKVVFVGDAVLKNQPPFLAGADLPAWMETLKLLLSPAYRNWLVVSGRGGLVAVDWIKAQKDFIDQVTNKIEKLANKKSPPEAVDNLVPRLLNSFKIHSGQQHKYAKRLRYGLHHYYLRHYRPTGSGSGEE
jgi:glyoxylase-like metal-dependent hydrolase (beta-lactamase superfamily II)